MTSLISLALLEVMVSVFIPQPPSWLAIYRRHPRLPTFALQANATAQVVTAEGKWTVHTDDSGHRVGSSNRAAIAERPTVLWLGDSFTFGHGVDHEQSWVGQLETRPGARFRHRNSGVPGYGPTQYRAVLEDELARGLRPVAVVVATFLGNDFHDTVWDKDVPVLDGIIGNTATLRSWVKRNFHTYRLVAQVYNKHIARAAGDATMTLDLADPEKWRTGILAEGAKRFRDEFAKIARICRDADIPLVTVIVPSRTMVTTVREKGLPETADVADPRAAIVHAHRILEGLGIRTIDLTDELAKHEPLAMYFRFDGHLTPEGNRVVMGVLQVLAEIN